MQHTELLQQYRVTPSVELRNKIAVCNDRLALKIAARQSATTDTPLEDLEQLARQGLLKAIERYDPSTGNAFSSFAVPYIRGEIQHYLRDQRLVKVPRAWQELRDKVARAARTMADAGRPTTLLETALGLGIPQEQWEQIEAATNCHITRTLAVEVEVETRAPDPPDVHTSEQVRAALCNAISQLSGLHQKLITESYWGGLGIKALAIRSGMSVARAKVELSLAVANLRKIICDN